MTTMNRSLENGAIMTTLTLTIDNYDFIISDSDVCNPRDFIPRGEFNPYNVRPWLLHDHGFPVAIAFASCLQDALDIAADEGKLDRFLVGPEDLADYGENEEGVSRLGNAGEPFAIESLGAMELPNPSLSFVALLANHLKEN